jgi:hypothetical protein
MKPHELLDKERADSYLNDSPITVPGPEPAAAGRDLDLPGVYAALGKLGPNTVITLPGLAEILGKDPSSVRRAIDKGQLPEPVKLLSSPIWTLRVLICHIENRLATAAELAAKAREHDTKSTQETTEAERKLLILSP